MKALLVDIDLLVRVIVPDDATDEQIREIATNKAVNYAADTSYGNNRAWIGEGVSEIKPDTEQPYDPATDDASYIALQQ
jgi:hypothetical protein